MGAIGIGRDRGVEDDHWKQPVVTSFFLFLFLSYNNCLIPLLEFYTSVMFNSIVEGVTVQVSNNAIVSRMFLKFQ